MDLDGNGRVNRREYLIHSTAMMKMPETLIEKLKEQHGFGPGSYVRWIGKFEAPWRHAPGPAKVKEFGRNVEGADILYISPC